jgi:hypothetical protein
VWENGRLGESRVSPFWYEAGDTKSDGLLGVMRPPRTQLRAGVLQCCSGGRRCGSEATGNTKLVCDDRVLSFQTRSCRNDMPEGNEELEIER